MQPNVLHFTLVRRNEPWIGPDCWLIGIYGPQNACVFHMRKLEVATQLKQQNIFHGELRFPSFSTLELDNGDCAKFIIMSVSRM